MHLKRPLNALRIIRMNARGSLRIEAFKLAMQSGPALSPGPLAKGQPQLRGSLRQLGETSQQRAQVKHRPAYQQWHPPSCLNLRDAGSGVCDKATGGIDFRGVADIDEVMGDSLAQLARRLGRADVE